MRVIWCVTRWCLIVLSLFPNFDLFHWWWRHYDVIIEKSSTFRKWHSTDLDSSHQIPLGSIIKKHIYLISGFAKYLLDYTYSIISRFSILIRLSKISVFSGRRPNSLILKFNREKIVIITHSWHPILHLNLTHRETTKQPLLMTNNRYLLIIESTGSSSERIERKSSLSWLV